MTSLPPSLPSRFRPPGPEGPASPEVRRLGEALLRRDPLADAVVEAFATQPPGRGFALLEQGLAEGRDALPEAPKALLTFLDTLDQAPPWRDSARREAGAAALLRSGAAAGIVLGMKSLVLGYASPAGNKALMFSGQLQEKTPRRLAETSRFVQAVSQPGGMERYGQGLAITVKVRIMHAQVRRLIDRSGRWQPEAFGEPINQHDMLATVILFSAALVEGLRKLGYAVSAREADDISHLWREVGLRMGVEDALLPETHAKALSLAERIQAAQAPPDDDSRALVAALFSSRPHMARTPKEKKVAERRAGVMQALCRHLIGDRLADELGVVRNRWAGVTLAVKPALALAARVNRLPGVRQAAARAGNAYWTAAVAEVLGDAEAAFAPPESLRQGAA